MDIQNLTNVSTVVINSLLMLLKDNHIDVNSVVMQLSNNKDEAISPEVNLGELAQQTLNELQKAKAQKVAVPEGFVLVPKTNSDAGIESMAMRYRHDFPLLDADYQEGIKSQMRQLYEEAVGLGFYSHKAQEQAG